MLRLISKKRMRVFCMRALVWVACVLLVPGRSMGAATNNQDKPAAHEEVETAEEHLKRARDVYDAGKYVLAEFELRRALSLDEKSPDGHLLLGMTYWQEGKSRKAIEQIDSALQYRPNYPEAHYYLSIIHWKTGTRAAAHKEIDLAITQGLRSFDAYCLRAQIELAASRYDEALASFEEAARLLAPNDVGLTRLREQIDAVKHVRESKSVELDPTYTRPQLSIFPQPRYTEEARRKNVQGSVRLAVFVSEEGKVVSTIVLFGLGYGLDEAAVKAARQLEFKPATRNGQPVSFWQMIEVEFHLRSR
jgi:TonB family protein